jgi:hypothetical protein
LGRSRGTITIVALSGSIRKALVRTSESTNLRVHGANVEEIVSSRGDSSLRITAKEALNGRCIGPGTHKASLSSLPHGKTSRITASIRAVACTGHAAIGPGLQDTASR